MRCGRREKNNWIQQSKLDLEHITDLTSMKIFASELKDVI